MKIHDNEDLEYKLRGVRTLLGIISEVPQGVGDFAWALAILEDALEECIEFVRQNNCVDEIAG